MTDESDWRDHETGRPGISIGQLSDGESITVQAIGEPYWREQEIEQADGSVDEAEALHLPVRVLDHPDDLLAMSDDDIDPEAEYDIINSSSGFFNALKAAFPDGTAVNGQHLTVTAHQPDDVFSRYYTVEAE